MKKSKNWENIPQSEIDLIIRWFKNSDPNSPTLKKLGKSQDEIIKAINDKTNLGLNLVTSIMNCMDGVFGLKPSYEK